MKTLFRNIQELVQVRGQHVEKISGAEMKEIPSFRNAWLFIENGKILDFGKIQTLPESSVDEEEEIDATGKILMPSWIDSHTHLVYAENRETGIY